MIGALFSSHCLAKSDVESCDPPKLNLELADAIKLTLEKNKALHSAAASLLGAEYQLIASQSEFDLKISSKGDTGYVGGGKAGCGLSVGGGVDFEKKFPYGTQVSLNPSAVKAAGEYRSKLQVRIAQPIFKGNTKEFTFSGIKTAQFKYRSASRAFCQAIGQMTLRTIELFYDIAKNKRLFSFNQNWLSQLIRYEMSAQIKEKHGRIDSTELLRAKTEIKQAKEALLTSKESLQDAKEAFSKALSLPINTLIDIQATIDPSFELISLDEAIEIAFSSRLEIEQGIDQMEESKRLSRMARNHLMPDLNFVVDYSNVGYGEEFTGSFGAKRESTWGFGVTTSPGSVPAFSVERSILEMDAAKSEYEEIKNDIYFEVKRSYRNLLKTHEKIDLQKELINKSEEELTLAKIKFKRNLADAFYVMQIEKTVLQAYVGLDLAINELIVAEYRFQFTLGLMTGKI